MAFKVHTRNMTRISLLIAGLLVAGCEKYIENWEEVSEVPELKVHAVDYTHAVYFDPVTNEPDKLEMTQLGQFLVRINTRRDDKLEIRYQDTAVQRKRAAIMKAVMEDQGYHVAVKRLTVEPVENGQAPPVTVAVKKAVIKLPDCPNWSDNPGRNYNNLTTSNFGCANVTNLGLMIDRPMDLVVGRSSQVFDGEMAASSIARYRKRETEPLKVDNFGLVAEGESSSKSGGSSGSGGTQ